MRFRLPRRSGSALALLGFTTAAQVFLLEYSRRPAAFDASVAFPWTLPPLLFLLSLTMLVVESRKIFRYLLGANAALTVALLWMSRGRLELCLIAAYLAVLPTVVYERYPTSLIMSAAYLVCTATFVRLAVGLTPYQVALYALSGLLVAAAGSLLGRYREDLVALQRYTTRLEDSVASLTQAVSVSQDYARDAEERSRLAERSRLTRDIHDTVGYTLTNNIMMMEAVKLMVDTEPHRVAEYVESIRQNTEGGLAEIRRSLRDLRSYDEPEETLYFAIKRLVRVFTSSTGVSVKFELGNAVWAVLDEWREIVYHFVQEGLINAFKHGRAGHVTLSFWDDGAVVRMTVEDDGQGLPDGAEEGIGIAGMRERFVRARGRIRIEPAPKGFRISGYLPIGTDGR